MSTPLFQDLPFSRWKSKALLSEPYRARVALYAHIAAGDLLLLGCVEEANHIFNLLYEHDLHYQHDFDRRCINNHAWQAAGLWPAHVTSTQPTNNPLRQSPGSRYFGVTEDDGPAFVAALAAKEKADLAKRLGKHDPDAVWTTADFRKARELATSDDTRVSRSAVAASIDIALALEQDEAADELMREHLLPYLNRSDLWGRAVPPLQEILRSPRVWKLIVEGWVRKALEIKLSNIASFVDEVVNIAKQRLEDGPQRPLRDDSIPKVIATLDKAMLQGQKREYETSIPNENNVSFLNAPASEEAIAELKTKIESSGEYPDGLPEAYKEFLRIANGIRPAGKQRDNILCRVEDVNEEPTADGQEIELLPLDALPRGLDVHFEWPNLAAETLHIGKGGDEGLTFLVSKHSLQPAIDAFDSVYENASAVIQKILSGVVRDIYGSVEELRTLDHIVLRWYHWNPDIEVFPSMKHLLENYVREARMGTFACDPLNEAMECDDDGKEQEQEEEQRGGENEAGDNIKAEPKQVAGQKRSIEGVEK